MAAWNREHAWQWDWSLRGCNPSDLWCGLTWVRVSRISIGLARHGPPLTSLLSTSFLSALFSSPSLQIFGHILSEGHKQHCSRQGSRACDFCEAFQLCWHSYNSLFFYSITILALWRYVNKETELCKKRAKNNRLHKEIAKVKKKLWRAASHNILLSSHQQNNPLTLTVTFHHYLITRVLKWTRDIPSYPHAINQVNRLSTRVSGKEYFPVRMWTYCSAKTSSADFRKQWRIWAGSSGVLLYSANDLTRLKSYSLVLLFVCD